MSDEGVLINIKVTLDRIATALEQMALERGADRAPLFGFVNSDPNRPVDQEPPLPTPPADLPSFGQQIAASGPISHADAIANAPQSATVALPPVQPFQFTGPTASCPVHRALWKTVPAGTSKKTGKPYGAFLVCSVQGCEERPRA